MRPPLALPFGQELRRRLWVLMRLMALPAKCFHFASTEQDVRLGGRLFVIHVFVGDSMAVSAGAALLQMGRRNLFLLEVDVADQTGAVVFWHSRGLVLRSDHQECRE